MHGRYDLQTVYELAEEYIRQVEAPYKELITFENSAHLVPYEEADRFHTVLINKVLQKAVAGRNTGKIIPQELLQPAPGQKFSDQFCITQLFNDRIALALFFPGAVNFPGLF